MFKKERDMIRKAAEFARIAHEGVFRKGTRIPYIYHPMEVALLVAGMTRDEDVIAAAYLHDVLEDTPVTAEELGELFGERVLALVLSETEDKALCWHDRKEHTILHLPGASLEVKQLTLADKLSNMRATARDYLMIGDDIWQRFREKRKECHGWYASGILEGLKDLADYPEYQEMKRLYEMVFEEEIMGG